MKISKKAFSLLELSMVIVVLAILIVGIMQGTKVVKNARLAQAQKLTKDSPVNLMDNLSFWIEPTLEESLINAADSINIKDGDAIKTWNDINTKSPNKKNVSQTNTSRQPKYIRYGINNLPSIKFDGTDWLERANVFGHELAETNSFEFFVVYNNTSTGSSPIYWESSGNNRINIHAPQSTTSTMFDFGPCCTANVSRLTYTTTANLLNSGNNIILNGIRRSTTTSGTGEVRVNGVTLTIANSTMTGNLNNSVAATMSIGGITTGTYLVNGQIAEVIFFSRVLESEDRVLVEKYLAKKWGIKLP